jgi:hypothetical protein
MDIEPDGQQFLNARQGEGQPTLGPPRPAGQSTGSRSIAVPIVAAVVVVVLIAGAVAFFALGGGGGVADLTGLEASGEGAAVGDRKVDATTTTTEPERETTTTAPPTTLPTTTAPPLDGFPADSGSGQPGAVIEPPATASCPGGSVGTSATPDEIKRSSPGSNSWIVKARGTAVNQFPTALTLNLQLLVNSSRGIVPLTVTIQPNPVGGGATTNWTYSGTLDSAGDVTISGITGSFTFSDPAYAHCQSGTVG